jgi:hypothetical protein
MPADVSQGQSAEPNAPVAGRRQGRKILLWTLVAVAAALGLGWGIQAYMESRQPTPDWSQIAPIPAVVPWEPNTPAAAGGSPIASLGLRPMSGEPGGIAPPTGATRRSAFERRLTDGLEQQAKYEWWGGPDGAAGHYRKALQEKGFSLVSDKAQGPGQRMLVMARGNIAATVAMRTYPPQDRLVIIVLTLASPAPAGNERTR